MKKKVQSPEKPHHKLAIVVVGDTHFGSLVALAPPVIDCADGQQLIASNLQKLIWSYWCNFWNWTEDVLGGDPFILVHNGDMCDGRHHRCLQLADGGKLNTQQAIAEEVMTPHVKRAQAYYQISGTPAHAGESSEVEESVAKHLGAVKDTEGKRWTRQTLWVQTKTGEVIQFAHHIATSSAHAYKSSPAMRLMAQAFADAGERGLKPPNIMVRSHVHDYIEVKRQNCRVVVCPCWQAKTGFIWKKDTITEPVIGGLIIRQGEYGIHIREKTFTLPRPELIKL